MYASSPEAISAPLYLLVSGQVFAFEVYNPSNVYPSLSASVISLEIAFSALSFENVLPTSAPNLINSALPVISVPSS